MTVRIEFYGIPRQRAGVEAIEVEAATLGEAITEAARALPRLAATCFDSDHLRPGYLANINADSFTTNPKTPLAAGDVVLILSADTGG